jgi:hypothetical protein
VTVVINGQGEFISAHDVASTSTFIPTEFDLVFTFTPTGGSPIVEPDVAAKASPITDTVTCTIPLQTIFSSPEGVATIAGTVVGFWTPRH